jgi:hypothetical protein
MNRRTFVCTAAGAIVDLCTSLRVRRLPSNALNGMEQDLKACEPEFCMAGSAIRGYSHTCGGIQRGS